MDNKRNYFEVIKKMFNNVFSRSRTISLYREDKKYEIDFIIRGDNFGNNKKNNKNKRK